MPDELPPDTLQKRDIVMGKGPVAKKGDTVSMQYVGLTWSTSVEFDASWDRGQPFTFKLGEGNVIPGWDEGIPGMRKGGRRELTIPAELAYGAQGSPPDIGPNECLRFIVDLVKLEEGVLERLAEGALERPQQQRAQLPRGRGRGARASRGSRRP